MELDLLGNLIGSVYFPIVCCVIMFVQNNKLQTTLTELALTLQSMSDSLKRTEQRLDQIEQEVEDDKR